MKFQEFQKFPKISSLPIHEQLRIFNTHISYSQSGGRLSVTSRCYGDGYGRFTISDTTSITMTSTTGYVAVRRTDNTIFVYGVGNPLLDITIGETIPGEYCFWVSDSNGSKINGIIDQIRSQDDGGYLIEMDMSDLNGLTQANFNENINIISIKVPPSIEILTAVLFRGTEIDISNTEILNLSFSGASFITDVKLPSVKSLQSINFADCNLSNDIIDDLINSMDVSYIGGYLNISGGTSPSPITPSSLEILDSVDGEPMIISGSSDSDTNGSYYQDGSTNGKGVYQNFDSSTYIYWNGSAWEINSTAVFNSNDNVDFPWQITTWEFTPDGDPPTSITELIDATWTIITN